VRRLDGSVGMEVLCLYFLLYWCVVSLGGLDVRLYDGSLVECLLLVEYLAKPSLEGPPPSWVEGGSSDSSSISRGIRVLVGRSVVRVGTRL